MDPRFMLKCSECEEELPTNELSPSCLKCGCRLKIVYDYEVIHEALSAEEFKTWGKGVWRYFELLPLEDRFNIVSLGEGSTFLQKCDRLANALGLSELYVKNETTNPTGSFVDRGMTVLVSKALSAKVKSLSCFPNGNLGVSLAAYTAKSGLKCRIFLSSRIDLGKLYQMIAYNANILFDDQANTLNRSIGGSCTGDYILDPSNPYLVEGKKTIGYEICEQLNWTPPLRIVSPMGTGGLISMIWKGINELNYLGLIERPETRMTGIQAKGCCPIVKAFRRSSKVVEPFKRPKTFAADIRVGDPPLGEAALKAIKDSNGAAIEVSDLEILEAIRLLAKTEGLFAEPSAASTIAGLKKLIMLGEVDRDEEVVCIITGSGLKDPSVVERLVSDRRRVKMFVYGVEGRRLTTRLGETKMKILRALSEREIHGYGIWRSLSEEYSLRISIPSVYQHLSELEALGLLRKSGVRSVIGKRKRRYYSLTERGKNVLSTLGKIRS